MTHFYWFEYEAWILFWQSFIKLSRMRVSINQNHSVFLFFWVSNAEQLATHRKKEEKKIQYNKKHMESLGQNFALTMKTKLKRKEKKKSKNFFLARHWMMKNIFQASRKAHVFPIFFFLFSNVMQSTIHAQDYELEEGCRAAAILWNSFFFLFSLSWPQKLLI